MKKILFLNPNKWGRGITAIWIASHSSILKKNGFEVKLFDSTFYLNWTNNETEYNTANKQYKKSKFVVVPNTVDASPRILTEALCYNLPCLVNYNILGGWKYVNEQTGEFFHDENDIEEQAKKLMNNLNKYEPQKYFLNNHGKHKEGKEFLAFIKRIIPKLKNKMENLEYLHVQI